MLTSETIQAVERIIDRFGFPIFVALCALVFFWQMFNYLKITVQKKDADYLAFVESSNKAMADYVIRCDEQIYRINENHNDAFRENSKALQRLSDSIELRVNGEIRKESGANSSGGN